MAKKNNIPTLPQLKRISKTETLQRTMDRLARRANARLLELERSGLDESSPAYRAAKDMIDGDRFTRSKNLSDTQMRREIEKSIRFLNMQTSTIKGENLRIDRMYETLKGEALIDENTDKQEFSEFLKSDAWKELKNIDSTQIMGEASVAIANGKNVKDLIESWKEYQKANVDPNNPVNPLEYFERWTEVPYGEDPFSYEDEE